MAAAHTRTERAVIDMHTLRQEAGREADIHTTIGDIGDGETTHFGLTDSQADGARVGRTIFLGQWR